MTDLTEFLLARIAEDEAAAAAAIARNGSVWSTVDLGHNGMRITGTTDFGNPRAYRGSDELWDDEGALGMYAETAAHVVRWDPARVLDECAAKRRIVAQVGDTAWGGYAVRDVVLELLALPYADHPDYDEAWRP